MRFQKRTVYAAAACFCLLIISQIFTPGSHADCYACNIDKIATVAGDMLQKNMLYAPSRTLPILATSFVNLDNLEETSTFGRVFGLRVASRFSQYGYRVIELKLSRSSLIIQERNGEFALSRDTAKIDADQDAQAIIVGTYTLDDHRLFVSTRLVSLVDKTIMSAYDFSLRMDPCLKRLMQATSSLSLGDEKAESVELVDIEGEESAPQNPIIQPNPLSNGSVLLKLSNPLAAKIVQSQLAMLGYYQHNIDGKWGKYSRFALSSFKRDNYLGDGSKWDMETQIALFNAQ